MGIGGSGARHIWGTRNATGALCPPGTPRPRPAASEESPWVPSAADVRCAPQSSTSVAAFTFSGKRQISQWDEVTEGLGICC